MNEGGDMSLSPHAAPALSDDDSAFVREESHRGSHSGGSETPPGVSLVIEHFYRAWYSNIFNLLIPVSCHGNPDASGAWPVGEVYQNPDKKKNCAVVL